ncbi:hypothetical protein RQP46_004412 [Phenoliferia psychrophenolica]
MARPTRGAKKAIEDEYVEPEAGGEDDEFEPPKAKKAKKAPVAKGKGKGRRKSKLELFTAMPLDVLINVCFELDPVTLLAMTRTSRVLRNVLVGDNSSAIWARAFRSVQLPLPTATDITPWAVASLCYDRTCHLCQKPRAVTVSWELRARACADCMRGNSLQAKNLKQHHPKALSCAPHSTWMMMEYFWQPTVDHVSGLIYSLQAQPEDFNAYVAALQKNAKAAIHDGLALKRWEAGEAGRRAQKQDSDRRSRKKNIEAKMRELGYKNDEFHNYQWTSSKHVDQPKDLTDRIWNTIRPHCIEILDEARQKEAARALAQQANKRRSLMRPFYDALRATCPSDLERTWPAFDDFADLPSVVALWKPEPAGPAEGEADDKVDPFDPQKLAPHTSSIFTGIRMLAKALENEVFASLAKAHAEAKLDVAAAPAAPFSYIDAPILSGNDITTLASKVTSALKCSKFGCTTLATFPGIVEHVHSHPVSRWDSAAEKVNKVSTSANQIRAIRVVLEKVGLDEATATTDLDALGKCFVCDPCPGKAATAVEAGGVEVPSVKMDWSEIVAHSLNGHLPGYRPAPVYSPPMIVVVPLDEPTPEAPVAAPPA